MSFTAKITADITKFEQNIGKAIDSTNRLEKTVSQKLINMGDSFVNVGKKASIFSAAVGAAAVAVVAFAKKTGDMANDLLSATIALDSSADILQEYKLVSIEAGTSTDAFSRSVESLTRRLKEAEGDGDDVTEYIQRLGVSLFDSSGEMRRMGDITDDLIKSLAGMENTAQRNIIASQLFGRQWVSIAPILALGADGIDEVRRNAHDLGVVLDGDALNAANKFSIEMNKMQLQLQAVKDRLASEIAPVLSDTLVPILEDKVVPAIGEMAEGLGDIADKFNSLPDQTKEVILAVGGIAVAIGPVLLGIGAILKTLPLIKAAVVALTGPIGLVVAAITAATALIITHWDELKKTSKVATDSIVDDWNYMADHLKTVSASIGKVVRGDFAGWWDDVRTTFDNNIKYLREKWEGLQKILGIWKGDSKAANAGMMAGALGGIAEAANEIETLNEEIEETIIVTSELTEALDIFQSGTISEAIRATSNEIKVLGKYLTDLQTGKVVVANVHDEIVKTQERLNVLNTALNTLTGDRELNIKVNTDSALDLFKSTDFGSEAGLVVPILPQIDTSLLQDGMGNLRDVLTEVAIDISGMLTDLISSAFASLGDALVNGDNLMQSLGASLLGTLGGILVQLGEMAIGVGIGLEAIKEAFSTLNPYVAIAAGAALIALGAMFSAGSRKLSQSIGGGGGGGYSSAPSMNNTSPSYGPSEYRGAYQDDFQVTFKIGTNELVGVLNTAEQRRNRI